MNVNEHSFLFSPDLRWKQWPFFCLWTIFTPTGLFQASACPTRVRLTPLWWRIHRANYPPRTPEPEHDHCRRRNWIDGQIACWRGIETESIEPGNLCTGPCVFWVIPHRADFCYTWPEHDDSGYRFGFRQPSGCGNPTLFFTMHRDGSLSSDRVSKHWRGRTDRQVTGRDGSGVSGDAPQSALNQEYHCFRML